MATKAPRRRAKPAALVDQPVRADGTPEGINLSQLQEWLRCRYRWHLRNRRHIERRAVSRSMDLGSAVHAGIAAAVRRYASYDKPQLSPKQWEYIRSACGAGINTFLSEWEKEHGTGDEETQHQIDEVGQTGYTIAWKAVQDLDLPRWQTVRLGGELLVEQKLTTKFLPGVPFYGTPDWVAKDRKEGGIFAIDFKVREHMTPPEHEEVDLQLPVYQYLLDRNGIPSVGGIKWQIRARVPAEPELNRNGTMSRQKITTTWGHYKAALAAHGLNPMEYLDMKDKLQGVEFFRMDRLYRNQFEVAAIWTDIITPLAELFLASTTHIRNMHYLNCNGCWAREFCLAELRKEDTEFLLETQYVNLDSPKAKLVMRPEDFVLVED